MSHAFGELVCTVCFVYLVPDLWPLYMYMPSRSGSTSRRNKIIIIIIRGRSLYYPLLGLVHHITYDTFTVSPLGAICNAKFYAVDCV